MYQYLENISGNIFQHSNNVNSHLMVNFISQHLLLTTNNSLKDTFCRCAVNLYYDSTMKVQFISDKFCTNNWQYMKFVRILCVCQQRHLQFQMGSTLYDDDENITPMSSTKDLTY